MYSKNNRYLIIGIFIFVIIFFSGTLAYWQWETNTSQQTKVTFTVENNFSCSVDGGGDITSSDVMLAPASCTNSKYAIKREITTDVEITGSNMSVLMDLWLDVNSIDPELKNSSNFKYAITTSGDSCTEGFVNGGTFSGNEAILLNDKIYSSSKEDKYYLYVWLDAEETNPNTQNKTFSLSLNGNCTSGAASTYTESILNGADPVLESGMIPVTIADNGDVTTADLTQEWYSYSDKQWANAVLVNSDNRMNYYNTDGTIKGNQPVVETDILAYFVWIPRYRYAFPKADGNPEQISVIFENSETTKSTGTATGTSYYTHPAFTFGNDELNGIWVGKFETTGTGDSPTILPNSSPLSGGDSSLETINSSNNSENIMPIPNKKIKENNKTSKMEIPEPPDDPSTGISIFFKVSLNFAGGLQSGSIVTFVGNNTYGLTGNTDSHMMKNSEWGAVAYLSHSLYGIGEEIRINNYHQTGYGEQIVNGISTSGHLKYGIPSNETNTYPQSTTGNISGVFDMSGGSDEYVMGNYNNTIAQSGFNPLPDSKYYNLYPSSVFTGYYNTYMNLCTLATCGGHALYETKGWYSDTDSFVYGFSSWFVRGGYYMSGASTGSFYSGGYNGDAYYANSFRVVITKG